MLELYLCVCVCHEPFLSTQVDFDESVAQSRFVVKPNVDPDLDYSKYTVYN